MNKHKCERKAKIEGDLIAINAANVNGGIELYSSQSKQWTRLDNITIDCPIGPLSSTVLVDKTLIIVGDKQVGLSFNCQIHKFLVLETLSSTN